VSLPLDITVTAVTANLDPLTPTREGGGDGVVTHSFIYYQLTVQNVHELNIQYSAIQQ